MKLPTEVLMEEHRAIERMIEVLLEVAGRVEKGEEVDPDDIADIIRFIRTFADRCHHAKEEDILFPAMEEAGIPRDGGPIGVMLYEHDQGRDFVKGMDEALQAYKNGDRKDAPSKFAENARGYAQLLTQHIHKEDNILYRMAEAHISQDRMLKMLDEFDRVEREVVGEGVHEEMHRILHNLEGKYLKS